MLPSLGIKKKERHDSFSDNLKTAIFGRRENKLVCRKQIYNLL